MIVFAREPAEPLGRLLIQLDQMLRRNEAGDGRVWVTFLSRQQPELDKKLVMWSQELGLARLPISVFEDEQGPPAYRLPAEATVVIVLARQRTIAARFVYTAQGLDAKAIPSLMQEIRRFVGRSDAVENPKR
uniref:Hypothetical conserved protein n=1 Tax=uncultured Planctomycetota bacterium TaxID=120965 RepID=H5SEA2_9BACT|nr:hypothetical conserved protein [uncultured Planctomycetota bacterium]